MSAMPTVSVRFGQRRAVRRRDALTLLIADLSLVLLVMCSMACSCVWRKVVAHLTSARRAAASVGSA